MPSNEKIAIAAHLHVLLRRKTGRVTDTEWMATNREYASEIARFAREKAAEDKHPDLNVWADKLDEIMATAEPRARVPLARQVVDAVRASSAPSRPEPPVARPGAHSIDTQEAIYPESGFIESTFGVHFGDSESQGKKREPRDPNAPRYVKGLR